MSTVRLALGLVVLGTAASAGSDPATPPPTRVPASDAAAVRETILQVRARELWTSSGERIQDGLLVVAGGKVRSAGPARDVDASQPLIVHEGVVTAGIVVCRSESGARDELQDDTRSVLGAARAVAAFDPASHDFPRALRTGITAMLLAPGEGNLVGGLACVVKTAHGRVLDPEALLALSLAAPALGRSTVQGGFLFGAVFGATEEPGLESLADGGPEWSDRTQRGSRAPTSYAGALETLERLFARGQGPFARAKQGELEVTIEAWERHEVLRAAAFAQELGLKGSIHGAPLAADPAVVAALQASKLGVVVGPYSTEQTRASLDAVKVLAAANVPVAFALDAPEYAPEELRLTAARALRAGAPRIAVWKALTEDGARLAGVGDAVGKLAPGYEADFVLWSGDPLDLASHVVAVYVDGERAWSRPEGK